MTGTQNGYSGSDDQTTQMSMGSTLAESGSNSSGSYTLTETVAGSSSQSQDGNDFTGDYASAGSSAGTTTTQENNGFAAGSTSYTETSVQSVASSEAGNTLTGDYQLASTTTTNTTLTDTGSNSGGTFSVGSSDSGTQTRSESGNHQDGSYSASTGSTDSYSWSQTDSSAGPSFTLTATGSTVATGTDVGNRVSGDYSTTQSGTDNFTLVETGTATGGAYSQTVSGSELFSQAATGNSVQQTVDVSDGGSGTYTTTDTGPGATSGGANGTYGYSMVEAGNWQAGSVTQSLTGQDRYNLLQGFDNVADTTSGSGPGHLDFHPFGTAFVDPPPDEPSGTNLYNPARLDAGLEAMTRHRAFLTGPHNGEHFTKAELELLVAQLKKNGDPQALADAYALEPFAEDQALFDLLDRAGPGATAPDDKVIDADVNALRSGLKKATTEDELRFRIGTAEAVRFGQRDRFDRLTAVLKKLAYGNLRDATDKMYYFGVLKGFVIDGAGGTIELAYDLGKLAWRYNFVGALFTPWERYQKDWEEVKGAANFTWNSAEAFLKAHARVDAAIVKAAYALAREDRDGFEKELRQLSGDAQEVLGAVADVLLDFLEGAADLSPEKKGRVAGAVLYALAENSLIELVTAGGATPEVLARLGKLVEKLKPVLGEERAVQLVERLQAALKVFGNAEKAKAAKVAEEGRQAAKELEAIESAKQVKPSGPKHQAEPAAGGSGGKPPGEGKPPAPPGGEDPGAGSGAGGGGSGGAGDAPAAGKFVNCFPADTVVGTEHGPRPIQDVRAADRVWAFDLVAGEWKLRHVIETYRHDHDGDVVAATVAGEVVESTGHHPWWVVRGEGLAGRPQPEHVPGNPDGYDGGGRWVDAIDLRAGDVLLLRSGEQAAITTLVVRHARLPVYNFHVEELHCYAVGHAQILVHNNSLGTSEAIAKHLVADHPERFGRDLGQIQRQVDKVIASGVSQETKTGAVISHHNGITVIRRPDGTGTMVVDKSGNTYRNWLALEGVK